MASNSNKNPGSDQALKSTLFANTSSTYQSKFKYPHQLIYKEADPNTVSQLALNQDYSIIIRKKNYYVALQADGGWENDYIEVFQVNNFMNGSASITTTPSSPGTLSITIAGGQKVVVATKDEVSADGGYSTFDQLLNGWNNVDPTSYSGENYTDILNSRLYKYQWAYAEKCDWQPMDEIYLFSKNLNIVDGAAFENTGVAPTEPQFQSVFFGYINSVTRSYSAGTGGLQIQIDASDQLKLLQISYVAVQTDLSVSGAAMDYNESGQWIVEANVAENQATALHGVFSGQGVHYLVEQECIKAGINDRFLTERIEPLLTIPFMEQLPMTNQLSPQFLGQFYNRFQYLQQAASILNLEFYADEKGNIVLKIPTFTVGINRLEANNLGNPWQPINPIQSTMPGKTAIDYSSNPTGVSSNSSKGNKTSTSSSSSVSEPEVMYGSSGNTVKKLQQLLNITADGIFGPQTKAAVENYQKSHGLSVDGIAGPQTWGSLLGKSTSGSSSSSSGQQFIMYTVKKGDNLWDISGHILGNPTLWRTYIYSYNTSTVKNPNLIYPGQTLKILNPNYKKNSPSKAHRDSAPNKVKQVTSNNNPKVPIATSLAALNDDKIPAIPDNLIMSFQFTDSDQGVYTYAQVTAQKPPMLQSTGIPNQAITRAVADIDLIRQFGFRPAPAQTVPDVYTAQGAQIYADMLILRSIMQRYTGSLTMIETPEISVGQPIRFRIYDEYPFDPGEEDPNPSDPYQAVFYVTAIQRSIQFGGGVSTMTLSLKAGRVMGQPCIYDECPEMYRLFYDNGTNKAIPQTFTSSSSNSSNSSSSSSSSNSKSSTSEPMIQNGSNGSAVSTLQTLLNKYGYKLTVDGKFGPQTQAAVESFQRNHNLSVDGIVGPATWGSLQNSNTKQAGGPSNNNPTVQLGSSGPSVTQIQKDLGITADGIFGPQTKAQVIAFQKSKGLSQDGIVGPQTWAALNGQTTVRQTGAGSSPAPSRTTIPTSTPTGTVYNYVVQKDDSLWSIAEKFYSGDGNKYKEIMSDNGISNPSLMRVGKVLKIYGATSGVPKGPTPTPY